MVRHCSTQGTVTRVGTHCSSQMTVTWVGTHCSSRVTVTSVGTQCNKWWQSQGWGHTATHGDSHKGSLSLLCGFQGPQMLRVRDRWLHSPGTSNFRLNCPICAEQPSYLSLDGSFFRFIHIVFSHSFLLFVWLSQDFVTSPMPSSPREHVRPSQPLATLPCS